MWIHNLLLLSAIWYFLMWLYRYLSLLPIEHLHWFPHFFKRKKMLKNTLHESFLNPFKDLSPALVSSASTIAGRLSLEWPMNHPWHSTFVLEISSFVSVLFPNPAGCIMEPHCNFINQLTVPIYCLLSFISCKILFKYYSIFLYFFLTYWLIGLF